MTQRRGAAVPVRVTFPKDELPPGGRRLITARRREIAVFNSNGHLYAVYNRCPHHRAPLIAGAIGGANLPSPVGRLQRGLQGRVLFCPWHHFEFDLENGRCLGDARMRVATYEVREEGDEIAVYV
jgi:nitrite reductase (NADH) small subunit